MINLSQSSLVNRSLAASIKQSIAVKSADGEANTQSTDAAQTPVVKSGDVLHRLGSSSRDAALSRDGGSEAVDSQSESNSLEQSPTQMGESTIGKSAVDTAIATDSSGLEAVKSAMQNNLSEMAADPKAFHEAMEKAFGQSYDQAKAETIRQQVLEGDFSWMPEIKVVDESVLQDQSGQHTGSKALGAYSSDNDTIYISRQLLTSDPDKAVAILTEEVGHGLDARLNASDAAGDEGDIFARIVAGESISDAEIAQLRTENDSGTIIVDGKEVEVEYGLFSKIAKGFKKIGKGIKNGLSKAWSGIKNGFKKVMQSQLLSNILMVAQFIPIPVVQVAVRVINIAKAAYSVFQGVKHGSVAMVLGGVASVAGGAASLGKMANASAGFVDTASKIANGARALSAGYAAVAKGDFAAAASLASNYFGGDSSQAGRILGGAGRAYTAYTKAEAGDYLGALRSGQVAYSSLSGPLDSDVSATQEGAANDTNATRQPSRMDSFVNDIKGSELYQAIIGNVDTVKGIVTSVREGEYTSAASAFLGNYGNNLGITTDNQNTIVKWAGVIEQINDAKELVDDGEYSAAIGQAAGMLGIPLNEKNQLRLDTVFQIRDSIRSEQYATASRQSAALALQSGEQKLAATFLRLANLLDGNVPLTNDTQNQPATGQAA